MANSFLFREEVKNSVPTFHEKNKQEWVGLNFRRPLLNFKIMKKNQFTNLSKFWQKQAQTFVNLIGMLILFTGMANAQVPNLLIQATSNASNIRSQTTGVAVDASGSIYSVGLFSGSVTFGGTTFVSDGDRDIFLVKYDNSGGVQWAKRAGGTGVDLPNGIAVSGDDVYITGYISGIANFNTPSAPGSNELIPAGSDDIFLAKYDGSGNFQWARRAGGTSSDIGYGVSASGSAVYITGYFSTTANFNTPSAPGNQITSTGGTDIFLAKFDNTGAFQWAVRAGGSSQDIGYGVAEAGNDVYITGYFRNTASFSSNTSLVTAGDNDIFLAKYTSTGTLQWARRGGGTLSDISQGVAISNSGVCITGSANPGTFTPGVINFNTPSASGSNEITIPAGNLNIIVAQFDFSGNFQWARRGGGGGLASGSGIASSGSDIYVTGYFRSVANFNNPSAFGSNEVFSVGTLQDMFLAKYSDTGTFRKAIRGGGAAEDYGWSVAASGSDIYVGGNFRQTANFNNPSASGSNELSTIALTGDAFIAGYSISSLPIELLSFKGQHTESGNLLTWTTANEIQNKGFDIERSKDGLRFDKIGFVDGNGTVSQIQNYRFEDSSPSESSEKIVYYRLKQLDFDGNFDYSNIISIHTKRKNLASIFPNRGRGIFTLTGVENIEDETFTIVNSVGQMLPLVVQGNGQFDISSFSSGIYYLRISSSGQVMKLVKE